MLVSPQTLTSLANILRTSSTHYLSQWTDEMAVLITTLSSRSALQFNTKLKAFSNGRRPAVTIAGTTSTTGTTAEKYAQLTWVLAAA